MIIGIIGASGNIARRVVHEALEREHPRHVQRRFTIGY